MSSLYDQALQETGVTITQYAVLANIGRMKGVSLTALAAHLGMDRTTLTRNLKPLTAANLVGEEPGSDKRERLLRLSAEGCKTVERAFLIWKEVQRQLMRELGTAEVDALRGALGMVEEAAERVTLD